MAETYFKPALFTYLKDLAANNEREWFKANKARYENLIKDPAIRFISDFGTELARVSPHFRADPRPVGGSLFRIYRDVRFSKDKSPYKTHVGIHFRHEAGKDAHAPGFYLHLEPKGCFMGAGIWHPDSKALAKIREALDEDPVSWKKAINGAAFKRGFNLEGESLKRNPKGYAADHPLIEDLRRKDFIAVAALTQREVTSPGLIELLGTRFRTCAPLVGFLCRALDVPF